MLIPLLLCLSVSTEASAIPAPGSASTPWLEQTLADEELARLASALAESARSRREDSGATEARAELLATLDELRRVAGGDVLARPDDLARAVWLARAQQRSVENKKSRPGKVVKTSYAEGSFASRPLELAWRLPRDYAPQGRGHALILALPDAEEPADQHLRSRWTSPEVQANAIVVVPSMPEATQDWSRVMAAGRPGGVSHVLTALRLASAELAVDFNRVYVVGHGKSVPTAMYVGNAAPQRFAGVAGRAGDAEPVAKLAPDNFSNLPLWFSGAGANAKAFGQAAEALDVDVTLDQAGSEADLWAWMTAHPRAAYPSRVTVAPGDPFPTRAYWLRIAPNAPDARIVAEVDREAGRIEIEGTGASQVTLYLNDAVLDLDRPIRVAYKNREHERLAARRVAWVLDLLQDGTSDPASVYVATLTIDLEDVQEVAEQGGEVEAKRRFLKALQEAGHDVDALRGALQASPPDVRERWGAIALRRIVRLAPEDQAAREALGHVRGDTQWFTSQAALERSQARQDPARAEERGLIQHKDVWLHRELRPLASRGWEQDRETGQWLTIADKKRLASGWARQDLEWIEPEQAHRRDAGEWRIDGEWLSLEEADRRHARLDAMWCLPSAEIELHSSVDRTTSLRAQSEMIQALSDLERVYGAEPPLPLRVALVHDEEQYDRLAFGAPDGRRLPAHVGRLHVIHSSFFAESWFERVDGKLEFRGMGVGLWDRHVPHGDLYGRHSARLACGLSYAEALDPSPKAVRRALGEGQSSPKYYAAYQSEKALPSWLRYGGAVYAERYFEDPAVAADGDPWWTRAWSLENLQGRGGLRPLSEVLAFPLDPDERDDGFKLLLEAGLVVAFVLDGGVVEVEEAHAAFRTAMAAGRSPVRSVKQLEQALLGHEAELRTFAGL